MFEGLNYHTLSIVGSYTVHAKDMLITSILDVFNGAIMYFLRV